MGYYSEYLKKMLNFQQLGIERKKQLKKISKELRDSDILVYAADLTKRAPISIDYTDIIAVDDQLSDVKSDRLTVILETPGGSGEVVEDLVRIIRERYTYVSFIIPCYSKSAGTIFAMSGNEILMGCTSALGPIDAQLISNGKTYSADALLEKYKDIRKEIDATNKLNPIYIPTLQNLSLGELKQCENAQNFSKVLVSKWLVKYKFDNWKTHNKSGLKVTLAEKKDRAEKIAEKLRDNSKWLTHGRSLKIADLENLELKIINYDRLPNLAEAINRYYALLRISFDANIYKIIETTDTQIYRMLALGVGQQLTQNGVIAEVNFVCPKCNKAHKIQANIGSKSNLRPGFKPFPKNNLFICDGCGTQSNLVNTRRQIEAQSRKKIVS